MKWFKSTPKSRQFRPASLRVESLESRACPAVGVSVHGHTMLIRGDANANDITITDDGAGGVTGTIDSQSATGTGIARIIVVAGAGNDTLDYSLTGALSGNEMLLVDLGKGADEATLNYTAGIDSGRLMVGINGGADGDTITVDSGDIAAGASAAFGFAGGNGNDKITFTSKANVDGNLRVAAEGGNGDDTIDVTSSGLVNGSLTLEAAGGNNNDTVTSNVTIEAGSTGKFRGEVEGGRGNDTLAFDVTDNTASNGKSGLAKFKATISGGSGTNTLTNTDNVTVDSHHLF